MMSSLNRVILKLYVWLVYNFFSGSTQQDVTPVANPNPLKRPAPPPNPSENAPAKPKRKSPTKKPGKDLIKTSIDDTIMSLRNLWLFLNTLNGIKSDVLVSSYTMKCRGWPNCVRQKVTDENKLNCLLRFFQMFQCVFDYRLIDPWCF